MIHFMILEAVMPIRPNIVENFLFYTINQAPAPVLDIWSAIGFQAIAAAVRLGLFEVLAKQPASPAETAAELELDPDGLAILLKYLETAGYVEEQRGKYHNSKTTEKWMLSSSESDFSPYFTFWAELIPEFYRRPEESIRAGEAPRNLYQWLAGQPAVSEDFQKAMIAISRLVAPEVSRKLKFLDGKKRILDIGGGHGEYSALLCRKYPELEAVILDTPNALEAGKDHLSGSDLEARIHFEEGDFRKDPLGTGYDAALVFNIIHGFKAEDNIHLFRRVLDALNPGGTLIVLEQVDGKLPMRAYSAVVQLLALTYYHTLDGQVYRADEIASWIEAAGYQDIRQVPLQTAPGNILFLGTRGHK
jgi:SAM-dependent methyltransferase